MSVNKLTQYGIYDEEERKLLSRCTLCPRECRVDRFEGGLGYCGADAGMNIASICIHRGEEPPISGQDGICNIFFSGCNLRCVYCQNYEISRPEPENIMNHYSYDEVLKSVMSILDKGIRAVGFVSPSHVVPQIRAILRGLKENGYSPITVYNTNSYDKAETIIAFDGIIDVYLPDIKYITSDIASLYSDAPYYPEVALKALKEMYYQKGSRLVLDEKGMAEGGMLVRHLVLPGHTDESKKVLAAIAEELSTGVHISLMSQYHPTINVSNHSVLRRSLTSREYSDVVREMESLGFRNGWLQDMESSGNYLPDFSREHPFENPVPPADLHQ
ncbi:MAG: radical SAM protein [Bacteroidales bacterium]|jgi:putative pyruvate formate lyase activating enzyme|nr:radical SAM protein [Bacteroidales bacterium]